MDLYIWHRFRNYLVSSNRHILNREFDKFIEFIVRSATTRCTILEAEKVLYRARQKFRFQDLPNGGMRLEPCEPKELLAPLPGHQFEGRLNPRGISYLYLSDEERTAVAEIRPWIGEWVSVGAFKLLMQ